MSAQHTNCLVCGSSEFGLMPAHYAHANLVKCTSCGFVFGSRIPTEEELAIHYSKYPRNTSISAITIKRYEELLRQFEPYRRSNRILDIGCGDSHFLAVAKAKGWEVFGTEFTDEAIAIGAAKGIPVHKGRIQSWDEPGGFDVITSFEVLEHINDGREHVSKILELLRKGGLFYFTTPNFNSLSRRIRGGKWRIIEYPEHLCYYTVQSIHRLLKGAGFLRLDIRSTGVALQKFPQQPDHTSARDKVEHLRNSIEENRMLSTLKSVTNFLLSSFNLGDTLKGFYVKP